VRLEIGRKFGEKQKKKELKKFEINEIKRGVNFKS